MKNIILLLPILLLLSFPRISQARVIEVQEKIRDDISSFLKKFAPKAKFSVKVEVKPLKSTFDQKEEDFLPYMTYDQDYQLDAWDNPESSLYDLYKRISEARIKIFLDEKIQIQDISKFKDAILTDANLEIGRDSVTIERIQSPIIEVAFDWREQTEVFLLGIMLMIAIILGIGLNIIVKKLNLDNTSSVSKSTNNDQSNGTIDQPYSSISKGIKSDKSFNGDLNIQDPFKISEIAKFKIDKIIEDKNFPTLSDMIILDELINQDILSFSFLMYELPSSAQREIYKFGKGDKWFLGFTEVGFPSKDILLVLDKMIRSRVVNKSKSYDNLLILAWRLGKELELFIESIDKEEAMTILRGLPKDISIPISRRCYPGSWGAILDDNAPMYLEDEIKVESLKKKVLSIMDYNNFDHLFIHKNRKDLIKYLDFSNILEEREIYSIVDKKNELSNIRPAFYNFMDIDEDIQLKVYKNFPMQTWAMICLNEPQEFVDKVLSFMSEKEKYLFDQFRKKLKDADFDLYEEKTNLKHQVALYVKKIISSNEDRATLSGGVENAA